MSFCALDKYLKALSTRKCIDKKMSGFRVNMAVLLQLEDKDMPLILEIMECQQKAIREIVDLIPDEEEEGMMNHTHWQERVGKMGVVAANMHLHIDQLAETGSTARWGDYEDGIN